MTTPTVEIRSMADLYISIRDDKSLSLAEATTAFAPIRKLPKGAITRLCRKVGMGNFGANRERTYVLNWLLECTEAWKADQRAKVAYLIKRATL